MKQAADSFRFLNRLSTGLAPLVLLAVIIPVLVLMGFGIYALFRYGYLLYFAGLLALCAAVGASGLWLMKRRAGRSVLDQVDESMVQPSKEWSEFDLKIWNETNSHIKKILQDSSLWSDMGLHAKSTAIFVAQKYHGSNSRKELAFSAIELLKMMEEVSRRYRLTLKEHVPYIEKVNISTLKMFYDHKDKASTATKFWNLYRTYRIFTPYGLLAEARGLIIGKIFTGVSQELQSGLKAAFLQEVASVAIDLYSGRFRFDEESQIKGPYEDNGSMAPATDPLRICMIGQVSAGKSAVVNALTGDIRAEVNRLPSTDRAAVHKCSIDGLEIIHLVDLPGLDGEDKNDQFLLQEVTRSDMVLWVVKASQSSRALDVSFHEKISSYYMEPANRSRKKPVFIGILSHVDRLKPVNEWQPPYNPESPDSPKARTIKAALEYNKSLLRMDEWIPMSVSEDKEHYHVQKLGAAVATKYDSALQTQLNRRRMGIDSEVNLAESCQRVKKAASALFKNFAEK